MQYPWMQLDEAIGYLTENMQDISRAIEEILPEELTQEELEKHFPAALKFQKQFEAFDRGLFQFMEDSEVKKAIEQDKQAYKEDDREPSGY